LSKDFVAFGLERLNIRLNVNPKSVSPRKDKKLLEREKGSNKRREGALLNESPLPI